MQEITETLEKATPIQLKHLREELFTNLQAVLPCAQGRELYNRRKVTLLSTDIYVIGFCLVCKAEDKRLKTMFRPMPTSVTSSETSDVSSNPLDLTDNADLLAACMNLKTQVNSFQGVIREMQSRIEELEEETTLLKAEVVNLRHESNASEDEDEDDTQVKSVASGAASNDSRPTANRLVPQSDRAAQAAQVSQHSSHANVSASNHGVINAAARMAQSNETSINQKPRTIQGSSEEGLLIAAAQKGTSNTGCQVYVGKLKSETTSEGLKRHLIEKVGISGDKIVNIRQLRKRGMASFSIELKSAADASKLNS